MKVKEALAQVREKTKKRKFIQSLELAINFKGIDFNNPEKRIDLQVVLPHGKGKETRIAVITGDALLSEAKKVAKIVITKDQISTYGKDKKKLKRLVNDVDFFICQADLMPLVGKELGQVLGPQGKMPQPVPGNAKLEPLMKRFEKLINVKAKGKFLPTVHALIGTEDMKDEDLVENTQAVLSAVIDKLPNREGNIRSVFMKMTMGPSIKVELK